MIGLLDEAFEEFIILDRKTVDDGYGGVETKWAEGATIKGAMVYDTSASMKIAQALGSTSNYTFTVRKNVDLDFHTVLYCKDTGKIFRITSNSDDRKTPNGAGLNMLQYSAEEWTLNGQTESV